jgi:cell wall-associated NlpC family hydrolase
MSGFVRSRVRLCCLAAFLLASTAAAVDGAARDKFAIPPHGVIGVDAEQLTPEFWIARLRDPDRVIYSPAAIAERNERLLHVDKSMHDLRALPAQVSRAQVSDWIETLSERPTRELFDQSGTTVPSATIDSLMQALALDAVAESQAPRWGLTVARAPLRTFPTALRVFSRKGDTDIDRFQEAALFPGTPVAIVHESADHDWFFIVSERYAAWIRKDQVAIGSAEEVLGYADRQPYRIVTGSKLRTVFTPEQPALSELMLDMSVRVPLHADWPAGEAVNGQHPYASYVIDLPLRGVDGTLSFAPALLQKNADTRADYLPLTRANIVRQAFKFLGERYGWGHSYDGRDCSGFVSDVYRSMGVLMPRNTRDQSVSAGLDHRSFGRMDDRNTRLAAAHALEPGDLVYIPGHVMMTLGAIDGEPYVIHDTGGVSYAGADGKRMRVELNEVSVSPLTPLLFNDQETYVDRMTSIVRIRPATDSVNPKSQE